MYRLIDYLYWNHCLSQTFVMPSHLCRSFIFPATTTVAVICWAATCISLSTFVQITDVSVMWWCWKSFVYYLLPVSLHRRYHCKIVFSLPVVFSAALSIVWYFTAILYNQWLQHAAEHVSWMLYIFNWTQLRVTACLERPGDIGDLAALGIIQRIIQ